MDITDFDDKDFLGYAKQGCKCGGKCQSCRSNEFSGYCGCGSHNYSGCGCGGNYENFSERYPEGVASEGDPVQPDLPPVEKVSEVKTASIFPMISVKNKYVKIALIAAVGYVSWKYVLKPNLK